MLQTHALPAATGQHLLGPACTPDVFNAKDLDLVIYGATGFTGKLAAKYLAQGHPLNPRWAIAGRRKESLEALRDEVSPGGQWPKVLVADLQDPASLKAMAQRARVVMTYAGPYEAYGGEALIRAALAACTHYADLSGEAMWRARMLEKYGAAAKARGVALVQSLGLDSLPADLISIRAAELLASDSFGPPTDVVLLWSKLTGSMSGGTVASSRDNILQGALVADVDHAYALAPEAPEEARVDTNAVPAPHFDKNFSQLTYAYPMAFIDGPTVRRSLTLTFPGAPIHFSEVMGHRAAKEMSEFLADPMGKVDPIPVIPLPGQGPPQWVLEKGALEGQALAVRGRPHTRKARVHLACKGDPAYSGTSRWSMEMALGLAFLGPKDGAGGYLTPALALGARPLMDLLQRADSGRLCSFSEVVSLN